MNYESGIERKISLFILAEQRRGEENLAPFTHQHFEAGLVLLLINDSYKILVCSRSSSPRPDQLQNKISVFPDFIQSI